MPVKLGIYAGSHMVQEIDPASIPVMRLVASGGTNPYAGMLAGFDASGDMEPIDPGTLSGSGISELTGDVTAGPGSGSQAATIASSAVSNSKLANMAEATMKGREAGSGAGAPVDLTADQASTLLDTAADPFLRTSAGGGGGITELTGDVTAGPGSGSEVATIANSAVTYAKIQNVSATDKLLGRSTAGAGVVEEIACTAAGRNLLDDADAAAQRTTLGLGTMATQADSAVAITGGTVSGLTSLGVSGAATIGTTLGVTGAATFNGNAIIASFFRLPITSAVTIVSGAVALGSGSATATNLKLDTEGAAASDNLDSITGGTDGDIIILSTNSSARDVVVKHSVATDKFQLVGAADFTLNTATSKICLQRVSAVWREMFRATL